MKKKDKEKLKSTLQDERKRIIRHLEDLSTSSEKGMQQDSGDDADIASMEIAQANLQKIGKREKFLLHKIEYALKKFDEDSYGECEECGEDIKVARLMARPVAQLCIDCKTEQEQSESRFSSDDPTDSNNASTDLDLD